MLGPRNVQYAPKTTHIPISTSEQCQDADADADADGGNYDIRIYCLQTSLRWMCYRV